MYLYVRIIADKKQGSHICIPVCGNKYRKQRITLCQHFDWTCACAQWGATE